MHIMMWAVREYNHRKIMDRAADNNKRSGGRLASLGRRSVLVLDPARPPGASQPAKIFLTCARGWSRAKTIGRVGATAT